MTRLTPEQVAAVAYMAEYVEDLGDPSCAEALVLVALTQSQADLDAANEALRDARLLIGMFRSFALSGEDVLPADDEEKDKWFALPAVKRATA